MLNQERRPTYEEHQTASQTQHIQNITYLNQKYCQQIYLVIFELEVKKGRFPSQTFELLVYHVRESHKHA